MKTIQKQSLLTVTALILTASLLFQGQTYGQDGTWTNTATGTQDWGTAGNWLGGIIATNTDANAFFNTIPVPTGGITVNVDSGDTVGNLFFGDTAANNPYIFVGQPLTLSATANNGTAMITVSNAGQTVTFNNQLVNDPNLGNTIQMNGPGTIALNSNLTQTVQWSVNGGTVSISYVNPYALTGPSSFSPNGLTLNGGTLNLIYLYLSAPGLGVTLGTNNGVINVSGGVTAFSAIDMDYCAFTGPGGLIKTGVGILGFRPGNNQNNYQGDTVVAQGTLQYRYNSYVIPNMLYGTGPGNVIVSNSATLDLNGRSDNINGLSGGGMVNNSAGQPYNSTLTLGYNDANGTFTGLIANNNSAGVVLNIDKEGAGTEAFTGANTYTGSTTVNGGTLNTTTLSSNADYTVSGATLGVTVVNPPSSLSMTNLTLNTGATLNLNFGTNANPASSVINIAGNYSLNDNVTINIAGNNLSPGLITLLQFAGANNSSGGALSLGTLPAGMTATLIDNTANSAQNVILNITSAGYYLTYVAGPNGSITGSTNQLVAQGGTGTAVTAVPNAGFVFSSWSDGKTTPTRTDANVTGSVTYTANFVSASAVNGVWTQTASGTQFWTNTANWSAGTRASGLDAVANFSTIHPSGAETIAVDSGRTVGSLVLGDTGGNTSYTFVSNAVNLAVSSGNAIIQVTNPGQTISFSVPVLSTNTIQKTGPGTINLNASATQVQNWNISGGTVYVSGSTSLSASPASSTPNAITLNGGILSMSYLYYNCANQGITVGPSGGTIYATGTGSLDNSGISIAGSGGLTKTGSGFLYSQAHGFTYSGDTTIAGGTFSQHYYANVLPYGAGKGNVVVNSGAVFDLSGEACSINGLSGSGMVTNAASVSANSVTLTIGNNNASSTFNGIIEGGTKTTLGVTKTGTGSISLYGANTFNGTATVSQGALNVSTLSVNSNYVVATGATLGILAATTNSSLLVSNLTFNSGAETLVYNLGSSGNPSTNIVTVAGNLTMTGSVTVNVYGSHLSIGSVTLLTFGGTKSGSGTFTLGALPAGMAATLTDNTGTASQNLVLNITALPTPQNIRWATGPGTWDLSTPNWQIISNAAAATYNDSDTVQFDDSAASTTNVITVTLAQGVQPTSLTVTNNAKNYILNGSYGIAGSTGLLKEGPGAVTMATANSYAGDTTISRGKLALGIANALPSGSGVGNLTMNPAAGSSTLDLAGFSAGINGLNSSGAGSSLIDCSTGAATLTVGNSNANSVFGGSLGNSGGALSLTKTGTGMLTLTANNSYKGQTTLSGGTVVIDSPYNLGATPATLTPGQLTLGGSVTLSNTVNVAFTDTNRGVTVVPASSFYSAYIATPTGTTLSIAGSLSASASGTSVVLDKVGGGTLNFSNVANYNATIEVDAGTIQFGSALNPNLFLKLLGVAVLGGGNYTANMGFGSGLHQIYGNAGYAALGANRTVSLGGGNVTWNDGNFSPNYLILGSTLDDHTLIFSSGINLNGYVATIEADHGLATVDGLISGVLTNGGLTKVGLGTLELSATNTYTGATTINAGKLMLAGTGSFASSSSITVNSNATLDVSAVSGFAIGAAQVLQGNFGTVLGNVSVNGLLAPGSSTNLSLLAFSNNLALAGNTMMKLNKSLSPSNDVAVIAGLLTCGGTLTPTNIGLSSLVVGDSFQLFKAGSVTGNFASIAGSPGAGLAWSFSPASGVLSVVSSVVPQPHITSISVSGTSLIISGTNGTSGQQYEELASTNLMVPLTNWVSVATNQFPGNSFSITNTVNPGAPQSFYILRVP